jgi:hypothetical protein
MVLVCLVKNTIEGTNVKHVVSLPSWALLIPSTQRDLEPSIASTILKTYKTQVFISQK